MQHKIELAVDNWVVILACASRWAAFPTKSNNLIPTENIFHGTGETKDMDDD